jgi:hypothetical protein
MAKEREVFMPFDIHLLHQNTSFSIATVLLNDLKAALTRGFGRLITLFRNAAGVPALLKNRNRIAIAI